MILERKVVRRRGMMAKVLPKSLTAERNFEIIFPSELLDSFTVIFFTVLVLKLKCHSLVEGSGYVYSSVGLSLIFWLIGVE